MLRLAMCGILTAVLAFPAAVGAQPSGKVVQMAMTTDGPRTLDPARGSTTYDNQGCVQSYETLLQVSYYDNQKFEPLLLAELPTRLDDGKRYRFRLKDGVRFHDDPCFPGGRGREIRSDDVFYSWKRLTFKRNPNYHECYYPDADKWNAEDTEQGLAEAAGQRLPIPDRLEFSMIVEEQPRYLEFKQSNLAWIELPFTYFGELFSTRTKRMNRDARRIGYGHRPVLVLNMIFRAFNREDPVVGGYTPDKVALRKAFAYAVDLDEFNKVFYEDLCVQYDGPIPPTLDGHPEGHRVEGAPRGPDLAKARALLAEAGYPNGEGLPPIRFYTNSGSINARMLDLLRRQLGEIGVEIDGQQVDFSQLIDLTNKKQAPMFSFAWLSDYPDAENNLALFYSKNVSPGSNHWNYSRPEFDELYEEAIVLEPGPERTALYEQMRDMVIADVPMIGSLARNRYYVWQPWLQNARPTPRFWSWFKYLDVDASER